MLALTHFQFLELTWFYCSMNVVEYYSLLVCDHNVHWKFVLHTFKSFSHFLIFSPFHLSILSSAPSSFPSAFTTVSWMSLKICCHRTKAATDISCASHFVSFGFCGYHFTWWAFYVHVTVHRDKFLYNKTNQMHQFHKSTPAWNSTCFGQFLFPSSGVYSLCTQHCYMSYSFEDSFQAGPAVLLESCLQNCMTYTSAECTVNKLLMMGRGTARNM